MSTYVVWVLIITSNYYGSHIAVVDNIASQANCRGLAAVMMQDAKEYAIPRCIAVRKVRQ